MAHERDGRSWLRAIGIGVLVSIITAAVMVTLTAAGLSPFPEPPSLAFAQTVIGRDLPLPVGLLFHTVYVTFWVAIFVRYFPRRDILTALGDRKSTRMNSKSLMRISYAVFCLKKKKHKKDTILQTQ